MSVDDVAGGDLTDLVPEVPAERIAAIPVEPREASRLLVVARSGAALVDSHVAGIAAHLRPGDLLVLNRTRVVPARLMATRCATGGRVELLFLPAGATDRTCEAIVNARGTLRAGEAIDDPTGGARFVLMDDPASGRARLHLERPVDRSLVAYLDEHGSMPLPPYVLRARGGARTDEPADRERYQTVFARDPGAVAAPTAGLHFSTTLLDSLRAAGVGVATLTLHVGPGTFLPIRCKDPRDHPMEAERATIPEETVAAIEETRARGGRVVAVGTTCTRALESSAAAHGRVRAGSFAAGIFIHPPFAFRVVDGLLTNFHLPDSTPCLLVAALLGPSRLRAAYEHALAGDYRFYSYGDAMLVV